MTNHVHLLLTPPEPEAVSQLAISLGRRYVQYINRTYCRTGTLWDSRYKSSLVHAVRICCCVSDISNSTPCAPRWWMTPPTIAGAAAGRMGLAKPTRC
jgi:putative transposase